MKVLHVYRTYFPDPPGGLQEAIRQICLATGGEGCRSRIFTLSPQPCPPIIHRPEGEVFRFRRHFGLSSMDVSLTAWQGFHRLVAWADVINYHFPWPFADLLHVATHVKKPTVVTYHSDIVRQRLLLRLYWPLMHRFLANADQLIATSPDYAASSAILRRYSPQTLMIPLGLDESSYPAPTTAALTRVEQRYGLDFFLFIGALRYYKGLYDLIEAVRGTGLRVVIAGQGNEEKGLRQTATGLGAATIDFAGPVSDDDKAALIQLCRAIVFPSNARSEAFGLTLLEGAMAAKPLISTALGTGTTYINRHDVTGLVVPPSSPHELRMAMETLARDTARVERYGRAARARFERLFTAAPLGRRYAKLYRDLLAPIPKGVD